MEDNNFSTEAVIEALPRFKLRAFKENSDLELKKWQQQNFQFYQFHDGVCVCFPDYLESKPVLARKFNQFDLFKDDRAEVYVEVFKAIEHFLSMKR